MSEGTLRQLLWSGRQIEFEFNMERYQVKLVNYAFSTEYAFGKKYGMKVTSAYFDDIFYRRHYSYSLAEMLQKVPSGQIYY
ncbi:hypothetical protein J6X13_01820 [Candidatus Saccharibacteria bacterium]|nr:hypothetical protein [Candidatus Saccharibacteria bacterium]